MYLSGRSLNHKHGWNSSPDLIIQMTYLATPDNPTTAVFPPHYDSHQMGRLALFFPPFISKDTCKYLAVSRPRPRRGRLASRAKLSEGRGETCLTSSSRALALSRGSRRRPAVAFRTTGVCFHSSSGTVFLAIFNSCLTVLPPWRTEDNRSQPSNYGHMAERERMNDRMYEWRDEWRNAYKLMNKWMNATTKLIFSTIKGFWRHLLFTSSQSQIE